jgi:predicted peroxiredoxin
MEKYAVVVTAGPDDAASAVNGLEYARSLAEGGHEVEVFLDGEATKWPEMVSTQVDHPLRESLDSLRERELVRGCAYCADVFGATEGCEDAGITLHGTAGEEHAPDVGRLASEGYELLTVG